MGKLRVHSDTDQFLLPLKRNKINPILTCNFHFNFCSLTDCDTTSSALRLQVTGRKLAVTTQRCLNVISCKQNLFPVKKAETVWLTASLTQLANTNGSYCCCRCSERSRVRHIRTPKNQALPSLPSLPLVKCFLRQSNVVKNEEENKIDYAKFGLSLIGLLTGQPCSVCRLSPDCRCPATQRKWGGVEQTEQRSEAAFTVALYFTRFRGSGTTMEIIFYTFFVESWVLMP